MLVAEIVFWIGVGLAIYVYVGYPALLWIVSHVMESKTTVDEQFRPRVTLIISAFNEEKIIGEKLRNSVSVEYPPELLEILVVSDASDDRTDAIVDGFAADNVRLLRMAERSGKTGGLNVAVEAARGDVIIFSDANAMYRGDAIAALVRNFGDPAVGAVVGESTYADSDGEAQHSESLYWRYEKVLKRMESSVSSVVGGDGAIYAIRRELYRPMRADALSDFVNPCQIVQQGLRCVYEPEAVSIEDAAGSFEKEFDRKVRIVNRAWRAAMSMKYMMNPFRYGWFSLQFISHKLLRWLVPFSLAAILVANGALLGQHGFYQFVFTLQLAFYGLALTGAVARESAFGLPAMYLPYYFCLVNAASARGILDAYRGKTYTTWSTARTEG